MTQDDILTAGYIIISLLIIIIIGLIIARSGENKEKDDLLKEKNDLTTELAKLKDDYNNLLTEKNKPKDNYNNLLTEKNNLLKERNNLLNELSKLKKKGETLNKDFICYFLWDIYQNMFRSSTPRSMINYFKYHCDREYGIDFIDSEGVDYDINLHDIISYDDRNTEKKGKVACINVPGYKIGGKVAKTAQVTIYK